MPTKLDSDATDSRDETRDAQPQQAPQPDGGHDSAPLSPHESAAFDQIQAGFYQPMPTTDASAKSTSSKDKKSLNSSLGKIASSERNASLGDGLGRSKTKGGGLTSGLNGKESQLLDKAKGLSDTVGKGYTPSPTSLGMKIASNVTKKRAAGGGIIGILIAAITALLIGSGSLTIINLSEGFRGDGNLVNNTIGSEMESRRLNSFTKIMTDTFQKGTQTELTRQTAAKLRAEGFEVLVERGNIKQMTKNGITLAFDGSDKNLTRDIVELQNSFDPRARDFARSFDNVANENVSRFSGVVARTNVLRRLGIVQFVDWIGASGVANDPNYSGNKSRALHKADLETRTLQREFSGEITSGRITVADNPNGEATTTDNLGDDVARQGEELNSSARENNYDRQSVAGEAEADRLRANQADIVDSFNKNGNLSQLEADSLARKIGGNIGGTVLQVLGAADLTTPVRTACETKGQLQLIRYIRNTLMAVELARFAANFYTVSDHQKAGLLQESSLKLMALYMAGATGSGGYQWAVTGGKALVAAEGIERYGVGYADVGFLAAISTFLNNVPGLSPTTCQIIGNPLAQIGGTIAGGVLSVASGGTLVGVNLGWAVGLTLAKEAVFAIGTPLAIRTAGGMVIDYYEDEISAGNALAAGDGALKAMTGNASVGLGATNDLFRAQAAREEQRYFDRLAEKSVFDRYFSRSEYDSLASRISYLRPHSLEQTASPLQAFAANPLLAVGSITDSIPFASEPAYAQSTNQCTDTAVLEYDLATDPFCNPIFSYVPVLDLENTENILRQENLINGAGEPIGEFEEFVENCFSGRTGVFHPLKPAEDGSSPDNDPTCVVGVNDETLDGDVSELFAGISVEDNRSWLARTLFPRASAQTEDITRVPTKKERFASWYGFLVDRENLTTAITDDFGTPSEEDATAAGKNVVFLGDSLTVGMQNLAGTDAQGNYLERTFRSAGWENVAVDAVGCRAVFQPDGPLEGGGGCPTGPIVDGITAASQNGSLNQQTGAVVIGLGTNALEVNGSGEIDNGLFGSKVQELVATIKSKSPSATIYWIDLSFREENAKQIERNQTLQEVASQQGITILPWNDYVRAAETTADPADDAPFADAEHHTDVGYRQKVAFLVDRVSLPTGPGATASNVDCSGYSEVVSPTQQSPVGYSQNIQSNCQELVEMCQSGLTDTRKIICEAFEYDGVFYGNGYGSFSGSKANSIYGFTASSGNYGLRPEAWLANRSEGLSPNNLLECSGLTSLALFRAYEVPYVGCSGNWTERNSPGLFVQVGQEDIRPGDFLTYSFGCNSGSGGHVAIAASEVDASGNLIVYETDQWKKPVRFTERNVSDFKGGWSRYIGQGAS